MHPDGSGGLSGLCFDQNKRIRLEENKTEEKCPKIPFVRVGIKDINENNIQASSFPESLQRKSKQDNKELVKII